MLGPLKGTALFLESQRSAQKGVMNIMKSAFVNTVYHKAGGKEKKELSGTMITGKRYLD